MIIINIIRWYAFNNIGQFTLDLDAGLMMIWYVQLRYYC